jgi:hypothetical protein
VAAAKFFTWDGDPDAVVPVLPRRPTLADLGGVLKEDDFAFPPDPETQPTAAGYNQRTRQIAGLARMAASAKFSVVNPVGGLPPTLVKFVQFGTKLTADDITIFNNGNGDVEIRWPEGSFPTPDVEPSGLCVNKARRGAERALREQSRSVSMGTGRAYRTERRSRCYASRGRSE